MDFSKKKICSFGKIFGGKSRYARQYINIFPNVSEYPHYIEPFAGGAGILMNKVRSDRETISDIDKDTYNVLWHLQNEGQRIKKILKTSFKDYKEKTFKKSLDIISGQVATELDLRAAAYIAANRMSRTGQMQSFATSNRLRGGQMGDKNAYEKFVWKEIDLTIDRLQGVTILNKCAFDVIVLHDSKETILYLDPPYLHETRVSKNVYRHEFTESDHCKLLRIITSPGFKSKVFLSGYDSDLYNEFLTDWKVHKFDRPSDAGQTKTKSKRVEIVWEN